MAYRLTPKQIRQLEALTAKYEPIVRDAFLAVADQIFSDVDFNRLVIAIEANRPADVIRALGIQPGSFSNLYIAMGEAYGASGALAMVMMPLVRDANGFKVNFQFNARNLRAERRLSGYLRGLIQDFTKEAEAVTRAALREGLALGRNPRQVAQELIGSYDSALRKRVGGQLVLNRNQAEYVRNMRKILNNDPRAYFIKDSKTGDLKGRFSRRDKRFDGIVKKSINSGVPLTPSQIDKLTKRYADRLLITRANTIGQTEVMEALNSARLEAGEQAIEQSGTDRDQAEKVWIATVDSRTRYQHLHMNNVEVIGMDTPFTMPDGTKMMYPTDSSLGAGASQVVGCRCTYFVRLNFFSKAQRNG